MVALGGRPARTDHRGQSGLFTQNTGWQPGGWALGSVRRLALAARRVWTRSPGHLRLRWLRAQRPCGLRPWDTPFSKSAPCIHMRLTGQGRYRGPAAGHGGSALSTCPLCEPLAATDYHGLGGRRDAHGRPRLSGGDVYGRHHSASISTASLHGGRSPLHPLRLISTRPCLRLLQRPDPFLLSPAAHPRPPLQGHWDGVRARRPSRAPSPGRP